LTPGTGMLTLTWTAGSGIVTHYRVRWRVKSGPGAWQGWVNDPDGGDPIIGDSDDGLNTADLGDTTRQYIIPGLAPGREYEVAVAGVNQTNLGPWTQAVSATTSGTPPRTGATLRALAAADDEGAGTLSPVFSPEVTRYRMNARSAAIRFTLTPAPGARFTISQGDTELPAGTTTANVTPGITTFTIEITSEDGANQNTYTIEVFFPGNILSLAILDPADDGTTKNIPLVPAFNRFTQQYTARVEPATSVVTLRLSFNSGTGNSRHISLTKETGRFPTTKTNIKSGTAGNPDIGTITGILLEPAGMDSVLKLDLNGAVYTLRISRGGGANDADLTRLQVNGGALSLFPKFSIDTTDYAVSAPGNVSTAAVTPTASAAGARITVKAGTGAAKSVVSGRVSDSVNLSKGIDVVFSVVVTASGGSVSKTYTLTVTRAAPPLEFDARQNDLRFYADGGTVILPGASGGVAPLSYSLSGDLPANLSFTAAERGIRGMLADAVVSPETTLVYTVTDSSTQRTSISQRFKFMAAPAFVFAAKPTDLTFPVNTAATRTLPEVSGGYAPHVLELEGDTLPAGLTFTASDRTIAGTTTRSGSYQVVYKATDTIGGVLSAGIILKVAAGQASAPLGLTITPAHQRLRLAWNEPSDIGGETPSNYRVRWAEGDDSEIWLAVGGGGAGKLTGSAAPGYDIDGLVNGTTYPVQVAAVNSFGAGMWSDSVEGVPADVLGFVSQQADLIILQIKPLPGAVELPKAERGATPYTYEVMDLPTGLLFDGDAQEISGTPAATVTPVATVTYKVTDANSASATQTFDITQITFDLDLDAADGAADAAAKAHDGIITARYLLGVRGAALLRGQSGESAGAFEDALKNGAASKALDVDADGDADGDDGILIARYLLGLRRGALVAGIAGIDADDAGKIEQNISDLLP
ncbi:MAG: cadherin-like beta sandwich domain-containing protein, partial [Gammaproteobacteria bacterium]